MRWLLDGEPCVLGAAPRPHIKQWRPLLCVRCSPPLRTTLSGFWPCGVPAASHLGGAHRRDAPYSSHRAAFWNSFSCDHVIAVLQSVPAFLLGKPRWVPVPPARPHDSGLVNPRSFGEVIPSLPALFQGERTIQALLMNSACPPEQDCLG